MSIGFIGTGTIQRTTDMFSGKSRSVDLSLQNVLKNFDSIRTDLDRLVDQAQRGTYDITSRQHYNTYSKESVNGWSENWYAEYRAVLALRADALQKKLQAAYNRVLEKSAYAEMNPDGTSVFAPYANRTYKDNKTDTSNLNNRMRISNVLMVDDNITTPPATNNPNPYTMQWNNLSAQLDAYFGSTSGSGAGFPSTRDTTDPKTSYLATDRAINTPYHAPSEIPDNSTGDPPDFPADPARVTPATIATRNNQINVAKQGIFDGLNDADWNPPPTTEPELSEWNEARDNAVEAGLLIADELWKGSVVSDDADGDSLPDDYRDQLDMTTFYQNVFSTVKGFAPGGGSITPNPPTGTGLDDLINAYKNGSFSKDNYMGMLPEDFRIQVPEFGVGEIMALIPPDIRDTLDSATLHTISTQAPNINQLIQSFVGMQYNNIYKGNYYQAQPNASSIGIYAYSTTKNNAFEMMENEDEGFNDSDGGSIIQAGAANGLFNPVPGLPQKIAIPLGPFAILHLGFTATVGPDLYYGHQSAIANTSSNRPYNDLMLPTIGLGSASVSIGIGPPGASNVHGGVVINTSFSYDILAKAFEEMLKRLKVFLVESMTVNSYATSSGTAMDSYAARAEYHFTQPGFRETLAALNFEIPVLGIPIKFPLGNMMETLLFSGGVPSPFSYLTKALGIGLLDNTPAQEVEVNDHEVQERLFEYKHATQASENRETETGAFFATNAFLGQFEMSDMSYEYWIGTQQNEELVNMDLARAFTVSGAEIIKTLISSFASAMGIADMGDNTIINGAIEGILSGMQDKALLNIMYDLMYRDQIGAGDSRNDPGNAVGQLTPAGIGIRKSMQKSTFTSEAYDYIENDHKPFEGDSDFNYKPSGLLSGLPGIGDLFATLFNANTPNFILEGMANTRRFTESQYDNNITVAAVRDSENNQTAETGLGPRAHAGRGEGQYNDTGGVNPHPDGNTSKGWNDTQLGDINEVYTAVRKVSFNDLTFGFGELDVPTDTVSRITETNSTGLVANVLGATRETEAQVKRYVGADSRITERRYDGASPVDHETFTSNMYTAGAKYYDRRNQYNLSFTTAADSGTTFNLFGSQALNPTMGGFLKMGVIDKNKTDEALVSHDQGGINQLKTTLSSMGAAQRAEAQNLGGGVDGSLNELNEMLYEHLHLRSDGKNLAKVKEYRDVFETGLMKSIFINGQTYHSSGGGITSSIELRYDHTKGKNTIQTDTRETYNASSSSFDPYNTPFLTRSRGQATIYLNSYFAYKKNSVNNKT